MLTQSHARRGDRSLSRLARFCVALMVTAVVALPANAVSGSDTPDEASPVIAAGDFNRDGIADLVEVTSPDGDDSSRHVLTVLLGQRDGTFTTVASQSVIAGDPRALVVGDLNGDGNPDVIVGDGSGALHEFMGDGKGNMTDAGNIATLGSVASMAMGRFTRDGNLDLVVSDFRSNSAIILLGSGNGSFRRAWSFQLPMVGRQFNVATADVNQDGIPDLVIASDDDDNYEVMLGQGNGTFTYAPELSHVRDPNSYCPS
jgi:FG-GAP-like repeat